MILLCRPQGRGNWRIRRVVLDWLESDLLVLPGQLVHVAGVVLRIVEVRP